MFHFSEIFVKINIDTFLYYSRNVVTSTRSRRILSTSYSISIAIDYYLVYLKTLNEIKAVTVLVKNTHLATQGML